MNVKVLSRYSLRLKYCLPTDYWNTHILAEGYNAKLIKAASLLSELGLQTLKPHFLS